MAFGSNFIIGRKGSSGMLRREPTAEGGFDYAVEIGEAHRLEPELIDHAHGGVRSVFAEYGIPPQETFR